MQVTLFRFVAASWMSFALPTGSASETAFAQSTATPAPMPSVLFRNVRVFDGKSATLSGPSNVLVLGNVLKRISCDPIQADPGAALTVIEGGGRMLMPGLIDAHAHLAFNTLPIVLLNAADPAYLQVRAAVGVRDLLLDGFTSVRDVGGPSFGSNEFALSDSRVGLREDA